MPIQALNSKLLEKALRFVFIGNPTLQKKETWELDKPAGGVFRHGNPAMFLFSSLMFFRFKRLQKLTPEEESTMFPPGAAQPFAT